MSSAYHIYIHGSGQRLHTDVQRSGQTVYDIVEAVRVPFGEQNSEDSRENQGTTEMNGRGETSWDTTPLSTLIPLHNATGLQSLERINVMIASLKRGEVVQEPDGLPNVKCVVVDGRKLLLFDGHHTVLAYMATGHTQLHEIPHIVIGVGETMSPVLSEETHAFYGDHAPTLSGASNLNNAQN
jgi:hypothetical protein